RAAWLEMEEKIAKPIHEARMQAGIMNSWMISLMEEPWGSEVAYKASTIDAYESWSDLRAGNFQELVEKAHPGKTPADIFGEFDKVRTLVRSEIRMLVDAVR
ncbi:MAG: hypothetical protein AAFV07_17635, partial [Bacteroidota bacterium]